MKEKKFKLLVDNRELREYLVRAEKFLPARRNPLDSFVSTFEIAPKEWRKFGVIVLPKGGIIVPSIDPVALKRILFDAIRKSSDKEVELLKRVCEGKYIRLIEYFLQSTECWRKFNEPFITRSDDKVIEEARAFGFSVGRYRPTGSGHKWAVLVHLAVLELFEEKLLATLKKFRKEEKLKEEKEKKREELERRKRFEFFASLKKALLSRDKELREVPGGAGLFRVDDLPGGKTDILSGVEYPAPLSREDIIRGILDGVKEARMVRKENSSFLRKLGETEGVTVRLTRGKTPFSLITHVSFFRSVSDELFSALMAEKPEGDWLKIHRDTPERIFKVKKRPAPVGRTGKGSEHDYAPASANAEPHWWDSLTKD